MTYNSISQLGQHSGMGALAHKIAAMPYEGFYKPQAQHKRYSPQVENEERKAITELSKQGVYLPKAALSAADSSTGALAQLHYKPDVYGLKMRAMEAKDQALGQLINLKT